MHIFPQKQDLSTHTILQHLTLPNNCDHKSITFYYFSLKGSYKVEILLIHGKAVSKVVIKNSGVYGE